MTIPLDLPRALVVSAMQDVTELDAHNFAKLMTAPGGVREKTSAKQKRAETQSVLRLASAGYAMWMWCNADPAADAALRPATSPRKRKPAKRRPKK